MPPKPAVSTAAAHEAPALDPAKPVRPGPSPINAAASASQQYSEGPNPPQKKKRHRAGKRRRNRRPSFVSSQPDDTESSPSHRPERAGLEDVPEASQSQTKFYRLGNAAENSGESLDSETLLDHRTQHQARHRRQSGTRQSVIGRPSGLPSRTSLSRGGALMRTQTEADSDEGVDLETNDRTPLLRDGQRSGPSSRRDGGFGGFRESFRESIEEAFSQRRRQSPSSSKSGRRGPQRQMSSNSGDKDSYDVNNPPSQPGSPRLGPEEDYDDVMLPAFHSGSPDDRKPPPSQGRDAVIDIDTQAPTNKFHASPLSPQAESPNGLRRKSVVTTPPVEDVCLPDDRLTEIGEEDYVGQQEARETSRQRRRKREWPNLDILEEWAQMEMQRQPSGDVRAKRVSEPVLVGGRLRPKKGAWSREDDDSPFRWTYFNEELDSSIRTHSITGLQQLGYSFRELFIPDPPEIEDSTDDEYEVEGSNSGRTGDGTLTPSNIPTRSDTRQSSIFDYKGFDRPLKPHSGSRTPTKTQTAERKPKRYGPRPVFWLDVLQPTYEEMRVLSRAFGIHKLTAEDIMEQEAREKVELFRNYYFVNYRTFEQDESSEDFMDPVNMYFIVFKGGVLSFHFSQMPHPANVRRRIRQLAEHQYTDSDWIAYALIDNITDAYAPIIEQIETQVDGIDDEILELHSRDNTTPTTESQAKVRKEKDKMLKEKVGPIYEKMVDESEAPLSGASSKDMLLRVGECRKKVMGMYRLLGNKADVIKGLAKRCNEQWEVAPRSDVGLYLGDIQDHIVTMTSNLTHYENILSRAHSNYLAQINIGMNERAEQTNDVLGKLTILGTIVLPMNIVTGIFGMNCLVPGQEVDNLWWFFGITMSLFAFGVVCYLIAKRVYHLV